MKTVKVKTPKNAIHIRRDRLFTLLGSVIIFATFVAKEGIGENLKDVVSSIDNAINLFLIRQDAAQNSGPAISAEIPTRHQRQMAIIAWYGQSEVLDKINLDLAKIVPKEEEFKSRAKAIHDEAWGILADSSHSDDISFPAKTEAQIDALIEKLYGESQMDSIKAAVLRDDVLEEAKKLKEKQEAHYRTVKWTSYVLFTLGWFITFYGQLSGEPQVKLGE